MIKKDQIYIILSITAIKTEQLIKQIKSNLVYASK